MAETKTSSGNTPPDGLWGRDEDFGKRLDQTFAEGEHFLLLSIARDTPFRNPKTGEVIKSRTALTCRKLDAETLRPIGLPMVVKTLSTPIYERAGEVRTGDVPAVVSWHLVPVSKWDNTATVLERIAPWPIPDDLRAMMAGEA